MDQEQVLFFQSHELLIQLARVLEVEVLGVVLSINVDQVKLHEHLEPSRPISRRHHSALHVLRRCLLLSHICLGVSYHLSWSTCSGNLSFFKGCIWNASIVKPGLRGSLVARGLLPLHKCLTSMNLLVIAKHDVIHRKIRLHPLNPILFYNLALSLLVFGTSVLEVVRGKIDEEVLIALQAFERVLVFLNLTLHLLDVVVQLLNRVFLLLALGEHLFLLSLLHFFVVVVLVDEAHQVEMIALQVFFTLLQGTRATVFFVLEVFNLCLHSVEGQLGKEHFFLLVYELVNVLRALLSGELDSGASDVHRCGDVATLGVVKVEEDVFGFGGRNISVLDSS